MATQEEQQLQEDLRDVIHATADRIHYAEGRRGSFAAIAGGLIAAGVAGVPLSFIQSMPHWLAAAILFGALAAILLGIVLLWFYASQVNKYPFTSATKTWKWFYRDALPNESEFHLKWSSYFFWTWKKEKDRVKTQYNSQLDPFKKNLGELTDFKKSLDQDMQQLYTLHINEKYKNAFLTHLRKTLNYGLCSVLIVTLLVGLGVYIHSPKLVLASRGVVVPGERYSAIWRPLDSPDEECCLWLLNVTVDNQTTVSVTNTISVVDPNGMAVPFKIVSMSGESSVAPKHMASASFVVHTPKEIPADTLNFKEVRGE
jgi:hypothetical protein